MSLSTPVSPPALATPPTTWKQRRVTVRGLGSCGGGIGLTRYLVSQGANVTVTDVQLAEALQTSLEALHGLPIRYVLGRHEERDFVDPDVVFVHPAVPLTLRYLPLAREQQVPLDSEMNLFVRQCRGWVIGIQQAAQDDRTRPAPVLVPLPDLTGAVPQAATLAQAGDVVGLSPACASYGQYPHYEARGEHFRTPVQAL